MIFNKKNLMETLTLTNINVLADLFYEIINTEVELYLLGEKVEIEKEVVDAFEKMSKNTKMEVAELVVIALKRFRAAHSDYERVTGLGRD